MNHALVASHEREYLQMVGDAFCRYYPLYLAPTLEEGDLGNEIGMNPTLK